MFTGFLGSVKIKRQAECFDIKIHTAGYYEVNAHIPQRRDTFVIKIIAS
jgi:hypothetical protein